MGKCYTHTRTHARTHARTHTQSLRTFCGGGLIGILEVCRHEKQGVYNSLIKRFHLLTTNASSSSSSAKRVNSLMHRTSATWRFKVLLLVKELPHCWHVADGHVVFLFFGTGSIGGGRVCAETVVVDGGGAVIVAINGDRAGSDCFPSLLLGYAINIQCVAFLVNRGAFYESS